MIGSLVIYAGVFGALDLLVWWWGSRNNVQVGDGPRSRKQTHQPSELFLAMSDEILLLD